MASTRTKVDWQEGKMLACFVELVCHVLGLHETTTYAPGTVPGVVRSSEPLTREGC